MPENSNFVAWKIERLWLMAAGRQKTLMCGMERKNVVAHGRLSSPARDAYTDGQCYIFTLTKDINQTIFPSE